MEKVVENILFLEEITKEIGKKDWNLELNSFNLENNNSLNLKFIGKNKFEELIIKIHKEINEKSNLEVYLNNPKDFYEANGGKDRNWLEEKTEILQVDKDKIIPMLDKIVYIFYRYDRNYNNPIYEVYDALTFLKVRKKVDFQNVFYEMMEENYNFLAEDKDIVLDKYQRKLLKLLLNIDKPFLTLALEEDWDYLYSMQKANLVRMIVRNSLSIKQKSRLKEIERDLVEPRFDYERWNFGVLETSLLDTIYGISISFKRDIDIDKYISNRFREDYKKQIDNLEIYVGEKEYKQMLVLFLENFIDEIKRKENYEIKLMDYNRDFVNSINDYDVYSFYNKKTDEVLLSKSKEIDVEEVELLDNDIMTAQKLTNLLQVKKIIKDQNNDFDKILDLIKVYNPYFDEKQELMYAYTDDKEKTIKIKGF